MFVSGKITLKQGLWCVRRDLGLLKSRTNDLLEKNTLLKRVIFRVIFFCHLNIMNWWILQTLKKLTSIKSNTKSQRKIFRFLHAHIFSCKKCLHLPEMGINITCPGYFFASNRSTLIFNYETTFINIRNYLGPSVYRNQLWRIKIWIWSKNWGNWPLPVV